MADERFAGDMSRNEVEIDLSKFMELVQENSNLKAKIVEMEANREPDNPWQRWIFLSNMIDAWRIFPRAFLSVYIFLLYYCTMWFMALEDPTMEQSGLISIVVGAGAAWFGLYAGTAKDKINGSGKQFLTLFHNFSIIYIMKKFKEIKKIKSEKKVCPYCKTTENADKLCGVYKCWK